MCVKKKAQAQIFVTKTGFYVLGIGDTASHFLAIINIACSNAVRPGIFFTIWRINNDDGNNISFWLVLFLRLRDQG